MSDIDEFYNAYLIIARINNLKKVKPDDNEDKMFVDARGYKYVFTKMGFVPAIQYSNKLLLDKAQLELERVSSDLIFANEQWEKQKQLSAKFSNEIIGKKTRSKILKMINDESWDPEETLKKIKEYLMGI